MHILRSRRFTCSWMFGAALCLTSQGARCQSLSSDHAPSGYVQTGVAPHHAYATSLGVTLPWQRWSYAMASGQLTGHWDLTASHWSSRTPNGRHHAYLLSVVPSLRWRGAHGRSAWFVQMGTGPALASKLHQSSDKRFSTRYNFASHLAVGTGFGVERMHEVLLRVEHFSNASLKKPNPGENFLQLRYARKF